MTDEEILKRLAEIEGREPVVTAHEFKYRACQRKGFPSWSEEDEKKWGEEGWVYSREDFDRGDYSEIHVWKKELPEPKVSYGWWNPLANWSDLGPMIEKYKLNIVYNQGGLWTDPEAEDDTWEVAPDNGAFRVYGRNKSLPHAICLAIIEAHK